MAELFDQIVNLCKRRGFVFPSAEIYGGFRSTYDYGPLGVLMLRNVKDAWWRSMVQLRDDVVGLDAVDPVARHLGGIGAPGQLHRPAGRLPEVQGAAPPRQARGPRRPAPPAGKGELHRGPPVQPHVQDPRGPVEDAGPVAYLRPRPPRACSSTSRTSSPDVRRKKPPFGIAQIGKSFRNEITPGNFVFRTREFEQMEMEYFVPPDEAPKWYEYWCQERFALVRRARHPEDLLRLRATTPTSCRHYSAGTTDVEFLFPWGWDELEGIANRTDYDLTQHAEHSGEKLDYFDQADQRALRAARDRAGGRRHPHDDGLPHGGLRRGRGEGETRTVLRLHPAWRRTRWPCCRCRRRTTSPRQGGPRAARSRT